MNCYKCTAPITKENQSREHIINSTIGGVTHSWELLCIDCNKDFGATIDTELSKQLSELAILLDINVERPPDDPKVMMATASGEEKQVGRGMKPHAELSFPAAGKKVTLFASEAKYPKLVKSKQSELSRKDEVIFVESTRLPDKQKYFIKHKLKDEKGNRLFGGRLFFRSVVKITLNYYLSEGYDPAYAAEIIRFVKGEEVGNPHFYFFSSAYQVHDLQAGEVSHIIHLRGDVQNKVLYAYIELFNFDNAIVIFSMDYKGEEFMQTYCRDVLLDSEIEKNIKIKLGRPHFEALDQISRDYYEPYVARYNRILQIIESRQLLDS